jgi:hypothetical protein
MKHRGQLWCRDVARRAMSCWHSGAPYPLRWPWWRCPGFRAAASPPPMSRLSPRRSAAAAFGPAQRSGRGSLGTASVAGGRKQRGQGERHRVETARTEAWAQRRYLIRCGESFRVGVEQELHHTERRALGGGVVQRKLLVLRTRRVAQHWSGIGATRSVREEEGEQRHTALRRRQGVGGAVFAGPRALSAAAAASRFASSSSSITSNGAPLAAA